MPRSRARAWRPLSEADALLPLRKLLGWCAQVGLLKSKGRQARLGSQRCRWPGAASFRCPGTILRLSVGFAANVAGAPSAGPGGRLGARRWGGTDRPGLVPRHGSAAVSGDQRHAGLAKTRPVGGDLDVEMEVENVTRLATMKLPTLPNARPKWRHPAMGSVTCGGKKARLARRDDKPRLSARRPQHAPSRTATGHAPGSRLRCLQRP
jgi:hypothetical protein